MTTKRPFNKPATTYAEQVETLKQRGMVIADEATAAFYLEHLNYYRLGAYWLPFEADHATHKFKPGSTFESVLDLYRFDRELRLLVLDAIERVEVSIKAHWAYVLAHRHGPHAHLDASLAHDPAYFQKNLADMTKEVNRADEVFIRHLKATYTEALPPVWAVCEVMSLGLLSRLYKNLKNNKTKKAIATPYGLSAPVLESWLHHLTIVRNVCAHHGRLWNREFSILPVQPQSQNQSLLNAYQPGGKRVYNTLLILLYFMDRLAPGHGWRTKLIALLNRHPKAWLGMGFPPQARWALPQGVV
jgi:abortive infection bacteriophage resistance protein